MYHLQLHLFFFSLSPKCPADISAPCKCLVFALLFIVDIYIYIYYYKKNTFTFGYVYLLLDQKANYKKKLCGFHINDLLTVKWIILFFLKHLTETLIFFAMFIKILFDVRGFTDYTRILDTTLKNHNNQEIIYVNHSLAEPFHKPNNQSVDYFLFD